MLTTGQSESSHLENLGVRDHHSCNCVGLPACGIISWVARVITSPHKTTSMGQRRPCRRRVTHRLHANLFGQKLLGQALYHTQTHSVASGGIETIYVQQTLMHTPFDWENSISLWAPPPTPWRPSRYRLMLALLGQASCEHAGL